MYFYPKPNIQSLVYDRQTSNPLKYLFLTSSDFLEVGEAAAGGYGGYRALPTYYGAGVTSGVEVAVLGKGARTSISRHETQEGLSMVSIRTKRIFVSDVAGTKFNTSKSYSSPLNSATRRMASGELPIHSW